jgi:predicted RNA-binding Zn ribbon-like protein
MVRDSKPKSIAKRTPRSKTRRTVGAFTALGGDPALDLLNTRPQGPNGPVERLPDFASVVRWCVQFGLMTPADGARLGALAAPRQAAEVRALREAFRAALEAGRGSLKPLVTQLNSAMAERPGVPALSLVSSRFRLDQAHARLEPKHVPAIVARCIAELLASERLALVRSCAADDCVLWFVDTTRNHSRQWCRMSGCGARAKARAYYQRKTGKS